MKRLHVLRHVKSAWDRPGVDDHERPLAPRGRRAGRALRDRISANPVHPDLVLCSTAVRARATLDLLGDALGTPEIAFEPGLYLASGEELRRRVAELPEAVDEVLLVGHNPGLHDLALLLAADGPLRGRIAGKLPTGALVTLEAPAASWAALACAGSARLVDLVLPREL